MPGSVTFGPESGVDCKYEGRFMKEALGPKAKLKEEEWTAMLLECAAPEVAWDGEWFADTARWRLTRATRRQF